MTRRIRSAGVAAVLSIVAGVVAPVVAASPAQAVPAHQLRDPAFEIPPVGACYTMSYRQHLKATYSEAPTDCAGKHTAMTMATTLLPDNLSWQKSSDRKLVRHAFEVCSGALIATLGGSAEDRPMTAYEFAWFTPSKMQLEAGARWLRCDVMAYGGRGRLAPIPAQPVAAPLDNRVRSCLTDGRGFDTVCSRPHQWRATGAVKVKLAKYPGDSKMRALAIRRCRDHVLRNRPYWFRWEAIGSSEPNRWVITCYSRSSK